MVLRRRWLADSVNGMKVDILCVYVQPILDDIISDNVSAVLVSLVWYVYKPKVFSTRVIFKCGDFFLFFG